MKQILFNTTMVKAILENEKSVTRRLIKEKYSNADITFFENKYGKRLVYMQNDAPKDIIHEDGSRTCHLKACEVIKKPYEVGDILYVRETWCDTSRDLIEDHELELDECKYLFKVDDNGRYHPIIDIYVKRWRPSIHMPKEAARIFLKVKDVRAEKLQDITDEECLNEGVTDTIYYDTAEQIQGALQGALGKLSLEKAAFKGLWDSTLTKESYNKYCWEANPWVWVIEFERM